MLSDLVNYIPHLILRQLTLKYPAFFRAFNQVLRAPSSEYSVKKLQY